ncbi:hypothetical protein [Chamaesiphon polymorphus]|nr:hypothetical protein [Chamaesiphon polymorphus]
MLQQVDRIAAIEIDSVDRAFESIDRQYTTKGDRIFIAGDRITFLLVAE